jgi:hypothetical protein
MGVAGIASQDAAALAAQGFVVTGTGDAASFGYAGSVIAYASATELPEVRTQVSPPATPPSRRCPRLAHREFAISLASLAGQAELPNSWIAKVQMLPSRSRALYPRCLPSGVECGSFRTCAPRLTARL